MVPTSVTLEVFNEYEIKIHIDTSDDSLLGTRKFTIHASLLDYPSVPPELNVFEVTAVCPTQHSSIVQAEPSGAIGFPDLTYDLKRDAP